MIPGHTRRPLVLLALLTLSATNLGAIEKNNRDRWEKPVDSGPDKDVPGYLINLGPTGARATLESRSFTVKYIFKDSPADGGLQLDDVITGVNGRSFGVAHRFGHHLTRMKEFPEIGYEGPLMDFGNAIEESEGRDMYDKGYYMSSRLHLTAAMALVLSMEKPVLHIQGK